tara:strand:+ start:5573 stop:6448 length:876 start_codon:yes stop_codon:yes gene_type:complete
MFYLIGLSMSIVFGQYQLPMSQVPTGDMDASAFQDMKQAISPLTGKQVRELRDMYNEMSRNEAYTGSTPPKPVSSSMIVDLAPGASPPVIRLGAGYISSILFLDSTGQPWPIKAIDVGNPNLFNVQWNKSAAGEKSGDSMLNTLLIQSKTMFKEGNIAVVLRGLNTPIMMTMIPGQKVIDYRVDVQVPKKGPNAKVETTEISSGTNPVLLDVLNGTAPRNAKPVKFKHPNVQGWKIGKMLYVRSKDTILSPGWFATMSAADGTMHAYEMPMTTSILLFDDGQVKKIVTEGT